MLIIFVRPESFPTPKKNGKNGFKWHDFYYSKLEGSENTKISVRCGRKPRAQFTIVHELLICAHVSTEECLKHSIQKIQHTHNKKPRCSTVFNFHFLPRNLPFSTFQNHQGEPSGHLGSLKFRHYRRNLICIEPYCGKSAGLKCDRSKSMEAPWIEKQDLFLS